MGRFVRHTPAIQKNCFFIHLFLSQTDTYSNQVSRFSIRETCERHGDGETWGRFVITLILIKAPSSPLPPQRPTQFTMDTPPQHPAILPQCFLDLRLV